MQVMIGLSRFAPGCPAFLCLLFSLQCFTSLPVTYRSFLPATHPSCSWSRTFPDHSQLFRFHLITPGSLSRSPVSTDLFWFTPFIVLPLSLTLCWIFCVVSPSSLCLSPYPTCFLVRSLSFCLPASVTCWSTFAWSWSALSCCLPAPHPEILGLRLSG